MPRQNDDERELGEFGGLEGEAGLDPAMRAVAGVADVRHKHQHQQEHRERIKRPGELVEPLIVERCRRRAKDEAGRAPNELHHQVVRAGFHHARAVKHHQPQRQQGGDTYRQRCDSDFHLNISKNASRVSTGGYLPDGVPTGGGDEIGGVIGSEAAGAAGGAVTGAAASVLAGIFNFWPTLI